ncbi:MAG: S8 family serine peptidase [Fimbriimonadaceae bacterium]
MREGCFRALACAGLACLAMSVSAQYSRVVHKEYKPLDLMDGTIAVTIDKKANSVPWPSALLQNEDATSTPSGVAGVWLVKVPGQTSETLVNAFAKLPNVKFAAPVFYDKFSQPMFMSNEVYIKPVAESTAAGFNALGTVERFVVPGVFKVTFPSKDGFKVLQQTNNIAMRSDIKYATGGTTFSGKKSLVPNDPFYPLMWNLRNTGQIAGFGSDPLFWIDINVESAWNATLGSPTVGVLLIDDGLDLGHQDINRSETQDFTNDGGIGQPMSIFDVHGTIMAGVTTGLTNNNFGGAGVAGGCKTVNARAHRSVAVGAFTTTEEWVVEALFWGQSVGCRVSNNPNDYGTDSELITDAYLITHNSGMIHFCAAGNGTAIGYPANIDVDGVNVTNAVVAVDDVGNNIFGLEDDLVDFSMPGVRIFSTDRTGPLGIDGTEFTLDEYLGETFFLGSSYSSSQAAGVAALMLSINPALTPEQIDEILQGTAHDLIDLPTETDRRIGWDDRWGWGVINAGQAVAAAGYKAITLDQTSVRGGATVKAKVELLYPAPTAGAVITLQSENDVVAKFATDTVTIPAGQKVAMVNVRTFGVDLDKTVRLSAIYQNVERATLLTVRVPTMASVNVTPSTFTGGNVVSGLVKTSGIAGSLGLVITLSDNSSAISLPASVTIAPTRNTAPFTVTTFKTSLTITRTISARSPDGVTKSTTVTLLPVTTEVTSLTLNPAIVEGGQPTTGTINLLNPAPVGGIDVKVSDTSSVISPPTLVHFDAGEQSKSFTISTLEVGSQTSGTVRATYDTRFKSATLTVTPTQRIESLTVTPVSIHGGFGGSMRIVLYSVAPSNGVTVTLTDSSAAASLPATVFIPAGVKFVDVPITTIPVSVNTPVRVRAMLPNLRFKEVVFTVTKL